MRGFLDAYETMADAGTDYWSLPSTVAYRELMAKKEAALAGWIAYVALANPDSPALTREYMHALFGPWVDRTPVIERRGQSWFLIG